VLPSVLVIGGVQDSVALPLVVGEELAGGVVDEPVGGELVDDEPVVDEPVVDEPEDAEPLEGAEDVEPDVDPAEAGELAESAVDPAAVDDESLLLPQPARISNASPRPDSILSLTSKLLRVWPAVTRSPAIAEAITEQELYRFLKPLQNQ